MDIHTRRYHGYFNYHLYCFIVHLHATAWTYALMNLKRLTSQLRIDEGQVKEKNRHMMYKDSEGIWTIGIGRNLERGLSEAEVNFMLQNDIQETVNLLRRKFWWFDNLSDIRQEVVINMTFNMGLAGFSEFKETIGYISDGDYVHAGAEMLDSKWSGQVGERAQRLSRMMIHDTEDV